jgi:hypothetical protein
MQNILGILEEVPSEVEQDVPDEATQEETNSAPITSTDKWLIAVLLGVIFLIVAAPLMFRLSNSIFKYVGMNTVDSRGSPTPFGWIIHTIAFIILVRILMH